MSPPIPPPTAPVPPTVWLDNAMLGHVVDAVAGVATPDGAGDGDPCCQQLWFESGAPDKYHENVDAAAGAGAATKTNKPRSTIQRPDLPRHRFIPQSDPVSASLDQSERYVKTARDRAR